jgi:predicted CXXCH cytochrome family protein
VRRTTKEIIQRYSGNVAYYLKLHSFRKLRFRIVVAVGMITLFINVFYGWWASRRNNAVVFYSPGPISQAHAGFANDCTKCHDPNAKRVNRTIAQSSMDAACLKCHVGHTFHQPNVIRGHACVQCHQEHVTSGPMLTTNSVNCTSCHGDAANMQASAESGRQMPPDAFPGVPADDLVYFLPTRPVDGYTAVITAFDRGHPAFQIQRENLFDPDTLKFNHERHFQADVPPTAQGKLTCASCHRPDANGAYMQRLSFERDCESCHSLQFDPRNPDLTIPHGDPEKVRGFLRTLPQLENEVFFSAQYSGVLLRIGQEKSMATRSGRTGCAYCHEVKASATGTPLVTAPVIPDRWYSRSRFDHAKHITIACTECHAAEHSTKTSDILLPPQSNCLQCHSTKGGVVQTCTTCHTYHAPANTVAAVSVAGTAPLRCMFPNSTASAAPKEAASKIASQ